MTYRKRYLASPKTEPVRADRRSPNRAPCIVEAPRIFPLDLEKAFARGDLSICFAPPGAEGPQFMFCEQDREFLLLKQIRFYRIGESKPFRSTRLARHRFAAHLANFFNL